MSTLSVQNITDVKTISANDITFSNSVSVGNSSGNVAITTSSVNVNGYMVANATGVYSTGTINAASHTVGTSTVANSSGVYSTTVNAASYNVGTAFTANATVVNAVSYYAGTTLIGNTTGPYGKTEGNLNVNNATTAYGKTEGNLNVNNATYANQTAYLTQTLTGANANNLIYAPIADNDFFRIRVGGDATNQGWVEIATADDGVEPIYVRQYSGVFSSITRTLTLLDGSGNSSFPGTVSVNGSSIASGGWTRLVNGLIMQWGISSSINQDSSSTVSFKTTFPSSCYSVYITIQGSINTGSGGSDSVVINNTSNFTINHGSDSARQFYWMALGV